LGHLSVSVITYATSSVHNSITDAERRRLVYASIGESDAVIGVAGSGKTTIMSVLRAAYEATGHTVAGASTAAVAAVNLQAESGIASTTIAKWLKPSPASAWRVSTCWSSTSYSSAT
jgi:N-acetylmuramic acid 6-phosphate (MurNAc-6-P) etherase